jgi:biopolymer transport protein ExbD
MAGKKLPEINASSMADIAFLLLVFFLVTTEIDIDEGINVVLPPWSDEPPPDVKQNNRNTLAVLVNSRNELLVEEERFEIDELRDYTKRFIMNNGRDPEMSDSPQKAIVSFKGDVGTNYETYIQVYNELRGAYNELRDDLTRQKTSGRKQTFLDLDPLTRDSIIRDEIKNILPIRLSEAEPTDFSAAK